MKALKRLLATCDELDGAYDVSALGLLRSLSEAGAGDLTNCIHHWNT